MTEENEKAPSSRPQSPGDVRKTVLEAAQEYIESARREAIRQCVQICQLVAANSAPSSKPAVEECVREIQFRLLSKNPEPPPIPLLLWCPQCFTRHIDEGIWATKPHRTHLCHDCGMLWRPAVVPTVGVQFLSGFTALDELEALLLEGARTVGPMTDEQRCEQAASFAFGQLALTKEWRNRSPQELDELRVLCRRAAGCRET